VGGVVGCGRVEGSSDELRQSLPSEASIGSFQRRISGRGVGG